MSLSDECTCSQDSGTLRTTPLFWESKQERSLLPEHIYIAAALLVGAWAPLELSGQMQLLVTAQNPVLHKEGVLSLAGWDVFLGLLQE